MNEIIDKVYDESWSYRQMGNFIDMCFMLRVAAEAAKTTGALIGNADAVSNVAACGRLLSATVTDVKAWERSGPRRRLMMSAPPLPPLHTPNLSRRVACQYLLQVFMAQRQGQRHRPSLLLHPSGTFTRVFCDFHPEPPDFFNFPPFPPSPHSPHTVHLSSPFLKSRSF